MSRGKGMKSSAHREREAMHRIIENCFIATGGPAVSRDAVAGKSVGCEDESLHKFSFAPISSVK